MLNPLEADGFITRERDVADRRRPVVTTTPAGKRHLASAARAQRVAEDVLFAPLTDQQRALLSDLLLALRDMNPAGTDDDCS